MLDYIRRIAMFIILESILTQLVTNEDYRKYIKMCAGMILVIIVLGPLDMIFGFTDTLAYYLNTINKGEEMNELQQVIENSVDVISTQNIKAEYENMIGRQIEEEAAKYGMTVENVEVDFNENQENYIGNIIVTLKSDSSMNISMIHVNVEKIDDPVVMAIKNYIVDLYGIEYEKIQVRY